MKKAEAQIEDAVQHGAEIVLGAEKPSFSKGYFLQPTILSGMASDMLMAKEETFAPVCGIFKFHTEDEVVRLANNTSMGLASYAFSKSVDRIWRMLENLEAGMVGLVSKNPFFANIFC